jgi:hypothetical protein
MPKRHSPMLVHLFPKGLVEKQDGHEVGFRKVD